MKGFRIDYLIMFIYGSLLTLLFQYDKVLYYLVGIPQLLAIWIILSSRKKEIEE